jgi:hypothetical protein
MKTSGGLQQKPISLEKFIQAYGINQALLTQQIETSHLENLTEMLHDVIDFSKELHMRQLQQIKELEMEKQLAVYDEKLKNWRKTAKDQVEISYAERTETPFLRGKKEDEIHYIETITSKSSQYNTDLNSLNNEAHLKVIAVFYNV